MKTPKQKSRPRVIKTVSLQTEIAQWVNEQAAREHRSASNFVSTKLIQIRDAQKATP